MLLIGYLGMIAMVVAASVLCSETSLVAIVVLPIVRMAVALFGLGYMAVKLTPLLFDKAPDQRASNDSLTQCVELSLSEFCLWFIPAVVLLLVLITAAVGFARLLYGEAILIIIACLTAAAGLLLPRRKIELSMLRLEPRVLLLLLPAGIVIIAGLTVFLPFTPGQWDALTYHLFIPARWVQEGMIFHVPTVFGDPAAAFAPGNALAFYGGLLALLGSDALMNCQAVVFQCMSALTVYKLARFFGGSAVGATGAGVMALVAPVIFFPSLSAYTDVMAQALLLAGVWWMLRYFHEQSPTCSYIAAMCCGLALGTKTVMLIFAFPILLMLFLALAVRRCWRGLGIAVAIVFVSGGWWYCRNLVLYGNPVFPAEVKILDMVVFEGLLPIETLRGGPFHVGDMRQLWSGVYGHFGTIAFSLMPIGLAGWLLLLKTDRERRFPVGTVIVLLLMWTASYCWVVPFNNQYRFLLGVWLLCLPGMVPLCTRIRPAGLKWAAAIPVILYLSGSILNHLRHIVAGLPMLPLSVLATLLAAAAGMLLWHVYQPAKLRLLAAACMFGLILMANEALAPGLRVATLAKSNAGAFEPAFRLFNRSGDALPATTIAYAGLNIPYVFIGPRLKNRVIYCNIAGEYGDGCYEFWLKHGKNHYRHERPRPYQLQANLESWLRNLEMAGAQVLAVMRLHPAEQELHYMTEEGFPPEAAWADSMPELFEPVVRTPLARVYLIDRDKLKARLFTVEPTAKLRPPGVLQLAPLIQKNSRRSLTG